MNARQTDDESHRRKPVEYHEGKSAAARFAAGLKAVLRVPKEKLDPAPKTKAYTGTLPVSFE